ncbi:12083_t:CDS:2 [Acaulospora colombiana]|uniref:12083_t:CDS:1 n=1 Tax=Acaulospora colombiana TaxID=27376 RepID=A0ACA9KD91_9GLOM|nr:12083_t:CDS:2 [Acaulospora colombiana]
MNERYPNATNEELERLSDRTCIICREEMIAPNLNNNDNIAIEDIAGNRPQQARPGNNGLGDLVGKTTELSNMARPGPVQRNAQQPQPQLPGIPFVNPPGFLANPIPDDQANTPTNQNTQQNTSQNSSSHTTNSGDRTSNEDEAATTSRSQSSTSSSTSTAPRWSWDQNIASSRTFSSTQQPISQPNISQLSSQLPPGLIPLFPILPIRNNGTTNVDGNHISSSLNNLSEEQIRLLETTSREALAERLRILQDTQGQIYNIISVLTQVLSALPQIPTVEIPTASTNGNTSPNVTENNTENVNNSNSGVTTSENQNNDDFRNKKGKGKSVTVTEIDESLDRWEQTNNSSE